MASPQISANARDGALVHAVLSGKSALGRSGRGLLSDRNDVIVAERPFEKRQFAVVHGVESVAKAADPFEVINSIVGFHQVDVIDLGEVLWVRNERHRHKPVDGHVPGNRSCSQVGGWVSPVARAGAEDFTSKEALASSLYEADLIEASDAPEIADLVKLAELDERHGSPFLNDFAIHVTGLPSGTDGLEIKSPSRGATHGGLAKGSTALLVSQEIGG